MSTSPLLQIAEPGQAEKTQPSLRLAGIDLGTTHSLVAIWDQQANRAHPLPFGDSPLLPSAVAFDAGQVRVGEPQLRGALTSFKRLMGLSQAQAEAVADQRCPLAPQTDAQAAAAYLATPVGGKSPEQASAEILKVLAARAERELGGPLDGVVITVPAYFDEAQRQATARAAQLADLPLLRLIAEPTAAALSYGLHRGEQGTALIYDLGGGTFDCSVVKLTQGVFEVLASVGDTRLGGDDMDWLLADAAVKHWGLPAVAELPPEQRQVLLQAARCVKEELSTATSTCLRARLQGKEWQFAASREQFEQLIGPMVQKTLGLCRRVLRDAQLDADSLSALVLVGGATRVPLLQAQLQQFFGRPVLADIDPDQVVAAGALRHARAVSGVADSPLLVDVTPLSLGLETLGGLVETVISRNTLVPAMQMREFTTARDGQTGLLLHVVQGERELVEHCRSLARFKLSGIPPMAAGAARIQVTFRLDESGLLRVNAREQTSGISAQIQTQRPAELAPDELKQMLTQARETEAEDQRQIQSRQRRVEAEALLAQVRSALEKDGDALLNAEQRQSIEAGIQQLQQAIAGDDPAALQRATEECGRLSEHYAQLRMDSAIGRALRGRELEDLSSLAGGGDGK